jgi:chromosome segregation ATPase
MSSSGGAPNAGTPSRTAVIVGQSRSPDPPPPCPHCDHAPSDPLAAATPGALQATAGAVNTFVETYQDLLARHQQAVRDLVAARRHNEELHARGRPNWDTVRGFVNFAQHRYDVAQGRLRQAIQHEADAAQDNEKLRAELQSFGDLRTRHAVAEEVAAEAYTRLQDYAIGLENRLARRADPSVAFAALPSVAQDLQDVRDESKNLKQRLHDESSRLGQQITDLGHRLQAANSDRDVALQDLFRLQKDYAEVRRYYDQWKSYGEERDREIRQLRKNLAGMVPAADLQASRIEAHVRGQRIAELEKLLAKSESRRHKLHDVHNHVVDKLKKAEQEIPDLKRQLYSSFRQHAHAEDSLQAIENKLRALQIEHIKLVKVKLAVDEELKTLKSSQGAENRLLALQADHAKLAKAKLAVDGELKTLGSRFQAEQDDRQALQKDYECLEEDREHLIQERRQLRFSLSQAEAEIANVARIRQVRDAVTAQVGQLEIELSRAHEDRDRAIQQRDETVLESQSGLLAQIADMQRAYQLVRRDHDQLQDRYDGLQKKHQDLSTERDSAIRERASALDRLTSLASAALREASTARRGRSVSSTRRSTKRSLSPTRELYQPADGYTR